MEPKEDNYTPQNFLTRWLDARLPLLRWLHRHLWSVRVPRNLNYFYTFGGILTLLLISQIISGVIVAMHYVPDTALAFSTKERFAREGQFGWLFTSWHQVGASFFFIAAYIHIARGLYYGSYKNKREMVWVIGIIIYFLMMIIAFLGYILVWGMMSTTAATVLTSFFQDIPFIGSFLHSLFLGDYSLGQASLNRFYVMHYILAMLLLFFVFLHIWAVHQRGQTNPSGIEPSMPKETIRFAPYMILKDLFSCSVFLIFFAWFLFYMPDYMGQSSNFIEGDPLKTPDHIMPEWYFLPFYSILRGITFGIGAIESTFLGLLVVSFSFLFLFLVPWLDRSCAPSARFRPLYKIFYWLFLIDFVYLGFLGTKPMTQKIELFTQCAMGYYFFFFLICLPFLPLIEKTKALPESLWQDYQLQKQKKKKKLW